MAARILPGVSARLGCAMETMIVKITLMRRIVNHWCASHLRILVLTPPLSAFLLRSCVMAMMTVGMGLMKESCVTYAL